jgi:hypothetical protein
MNRPPLPVLNPILVRCPLTGKLIPVCCCPLNK